MVLINEWLPNPTGSDISGSPSQVLPGKTLEGEWIELFNSGSAPADLAGWTLVMKNGKSFTFKNGTIGAGEYKVFARKETKLTLKNTDEAISLLDPSGRVAQKSEFLGTAPEGKSFNLVGTTFIFEDPSPGRANEAPKMSANISQAFPFNQPLHSGVGFGTVIFIALGAALLLSLFIIILLRKDDELSHLFFSRD